MWHHFAMSLGAIALIIDFVPALASAQNVKITPLGSHDGEFCSADPAKCVRSC
jgi:hypothetical protein